VAITALPLHLQLLAMMVAMARDETQRHSIQNKPLPT
jgi:hypothetical protein